MPKTKYTRENLSAAVTAAALPAVKNLLGSVKGLGTDRKPKEAKGQEN